MAESAREGGWRAYFNGFVLAAIALMAGHGAWSASRESALNGDVRTAALEARRIYDAFDRYYQRHQAFPGSHTGAAFDVETFEPLRRRGYYDGRVLGQLRQGRADGYASPDDRGINQEYWLELSLARDPRVRLLVARSDDAPMSGGAWCDGVYLFRDGTLEPLP